MKFLFAALATMAATAHGTAIPWTNCGTDADMISVNTLDATPWPPVEGQDLTVSVDALLKEAVEADATFSITAKVFGVKVFSKTGKLADLNPPEGILPVPAGEFTQTQTVAIPSLPISGTVKVHVTANDAQGNELVCGDASVKIAKKFEAVTDAPIASETIVAASPKCPGSGASMHASCSMNLNFKNSCAEVHDEIVARVSGAPSAWHDPHNNGTYTITSNTGSEIDLTRVTGDKKYTDKMIIALTDNGAGCTATACSESQVTSLLDFNTNYCNLHDLYCGSDAGCKVLKNDLTFEESLVKCRQHDASACLAV